MNRRITLAVALCALVALTASSAATAASSLPRGKYPCYGSAGYLFFDIVVTGPGTYLNAKKNGSYTLRGTKIVFLSGGLKGVNAKLVRPTAIGLNMNGSSTYATTCTLTR